MKTILIIAVAVLAIELTLPTATAGEGPWTKRRGVLD